MAMYIPADLRQPINDRVRPANGRCFSLQELYQYTEGGPIELFPLPDGRLMVCNEEAKLQGEVRKNTRATEFVVFPSVSEVQVLMAQWAAQGETVIFVGELPEDGDAPVDYIAGDVLICEAGELE